MYSFEFFLVWCVYAACVRYGVGVVDVVVIIVITIATLHPLYFMHEIHGNYWLKHLNLDRQTDKHTRSLSLECVTFSAYFTCLFSSFHRFLSSNLYNNGIFITSILCRFVFHLVWFGLVFSSAQFNSHPR